MPIAGDAVTNHNQYQQQRQQLVDYLYAWIPFSCCSWLIGMQLILANTHKHTSCLLLPYCRYLQLRSRKSREPQPKVVIGPLWQWHCVCVCLHATIWGTLRFELSQCRLLGQQQLIHQRNVYTTVYTTLSDSGADLVSSRTCHCVRLLWRDGSSYMRCKQTAIQGR